MIMPSRLAPRETRGSTVCKSPSGGRRFLMKCNEQRRGHRSSDASAVRWPGRPGSNPIEAKKHAAARAAIIAKLEATLQKEKLALGGRSFLRCLRQHRSTIERTDLLSRSQTPEGNRFPARIVSWVRSRLTRALSGGVPTSRTHWLEFRGGGEPGCSAPRPVPPWPAGSRKRHPTLRSRESARD